MNIKYFYNKILARTVCQLLLLGIVFLLIACGKHKEGETSAAKSEPSLKSDSSIKTIPDASVLSLPVGTKPKDFKDVKTYDESFTDALLKDTLSMHKLPEIKSASYVVADKNYGLGLCYEKPTNIKLTNYKYRLPDYKGFQIYYMTGDAERTGELKAEFGVDCLSAYGNLIVYNPKTQKATVLTVYYSFYIDSQQERNFYIDTDYTIYLADASYSEGEDDADFNQGAVYKAIITDNGGFAISKIYEPQ